MPTEHCVPILRAMLFSAAILAATPTGVFAADTSNATEVTAVEARQEKVIVVDSVPVKEENETVKETAESQESSVGDEAAHEVAYKDLGVFQLSAYCTHRCCNGNNKGTALGTPLKPYYTVAVDPSVIKLGTKLEIELPTKGWTEFLAEDTGSGVDGKWIDVCLPEHSQCFQDEYNGRCRVRQVLE